LPAWRPTPSPYNSSSSPVQEAGDVAGAIKMFHDVIALPDKQNELQKIKEQSAYK
jgi:hypothetical protein